jgi:hypothetical protein
MSTKEGLCKLGNYSNLDNGCPTLSSVPQRKKKWPISNVTSLKEPVSLGQ